MKLFQRLKVFLLYFIVSLKTKKVLCACGGSIRPKLRDGEPSYTSVMVYTRAGSEEGRHYENRWDLLCYIFFSQIFENLVSRCNKKKCQRGYFHGFSVKVNKEQPKMTYHYDDDCLESKYLVTSRETW